MRPTWRPSSRTKIAGHRARVTLRPILYACWSVCVCVFAHVRFCSSDYYYESTARRLAAARAQRLSYMLPVPSAFGGRPRRNRVWGAEARVAGSRPMAATTVPWYTPCASSRCLRQSPLDYTSHHRDRPRRPTRRPSIHLIIEIVLTAQHGVRLYISSSRPSSPPNTAPMPPPSAIACKAEGEASSDSQDRSL